MPAAGNLDRLVTIEQQVGFIQDSSGQRTANWQPVVAVGDNGNAWAGKRDIGGSELVEAQAVNGEITTLWTLHWVAGIKAEMRLVYDGLNYDIKFPRELGRRQGLELMTTAGHE